MDIANFLNVGGFMFFSIILSVGYFFLEVIVGKVEGFHSIINRNEKSIFDRVMHYVFWGVLINIIFVALSYNVPESTNKLNDLFNASGRMGEALKGIFPELNPKSVQLVVFSISYTLGIFFFLIFGKFAIIIGSLLERIYNKISYIKSGRNNKSKRKNG